MSDAPPPNAQLNDNAHTSSAANTPFGASGGASPLGRRLPRTFYQRSPRRVARELLGMALLRRDCDGVWCGGWIVETEAYLARGDAASHSAIGPTARNASMFAQPGTLYVYSIHAKYCLNAVTQQSGTGSAVLIRALQPVWGLDRMQQRRGLNTVDRRLTSGPARTCQALDVTKKNDGLDLVEDANFAIVRPRLPFSFKIITGSRIGISSAVDQRLRFFIDGNLFVSGRRREHSKPAVDRLPCAEPPVQSRISIDSTTPSD
ncbi:DNA-3-methyladenine glycosylase [Roseimaritima ulvae]|uniref:Putative 3-methyladenine DNA glycosylase n=1 Tax=Roseimaritima ulvae TaxID=980254 RepID=A0A5B9QLB2_9BACT|nr:DNA-3-methyladenine glycosylase [Roseimaritima ulvae]QEG39724.1 3-methyladenine DNA glycosylase [Roseimaritima ulvae]